MAGSIAYRKDILAIQTASARQIFAGIQQKPMANGFKMRKGM
jgi:hypothetical protein